MNRYGLEINILLLIYRMRTMWYNFKYWIVLISSFYYRAKLALDVAVINSLIILPTYMRPNEHYITNRLCLCLKINILI